MKGGERLRMNDQQEPFHEDRPYGKRMGKKKSGFDQYYDEAVEPGKRERAYAWATAIGLQDVDGLKPSKHLIATARRHIEGEITQEEARRIVDEYYETKDGSKGAEAVAGLHRLRTAESEKHDIQSEKLDIGGEKLDIGDGKLDIGGLSKPTIVNIKKLFSAYSDRPFFRRKDVLTMLDMSPTAASDLLDKMLSRRIIERVKGHGKGACRFVVNIDAAYGKKMVEYAV